MRQFSDQHLAALAVMAVGIIAAVWIGRRGTNRAKTAFAYTLAALILLGWIGEYIDDAVLGQWSTTYTLPLQLTDAVSAVAVLALLTRRQFPVELTYFWAFTATLQATLTPDLGQGFPNVLYFTYFLYHLGAIVAAAFLVFGCRHYPRPTAVWRVFAATLVWAAIAGAADVITGGNYMYLRAKPLHNSLLSVMGPWPWYIVGGIGVGLAMLLLVAALTELFRGQPLRRILPATHRLSRNQLRGLYSHAQDLWLTPRRDPRA
ncbi:MAG TPA: TIGR02206 family membrane protein [Solirubrobacteraceae bacterium]|nr:TIGR02206 family membrane protein [Solirubrobacteraceae bacterium]